MSENKFEIFKAELAAAKKQVEEAHEDYGNRSYVHRAALEIMEFEKEIFYGDVSSNHHLKKIKEIVEKYSPEINHEINKA